MPVVKRKFYYYSHIVRPRDQGMTSTEKMVVILTSPKRRGAYHTTGSTIINQEAEEERGKMWARDFTVVSARNTS